MKRSRATLVGLVLLLLLAVAAPFFIPGPNGKPLMSVDRLKRILSDQFPVAHEVDRLQMKAKEAAVEIRKKLQADDKPEKVAAPSEQPSEIPEKAAAPSEHPPETLYKWRDRKGTWHFTNRPPPEGVAYTVVKWAGTENPPVDQEK